MDRGPVMPEPPQSPSPGESAAERRARERAAREGRRTAAQQPRRRKPRRRRGEVPDPAARSAAARRRRRTLAAIVIAAFVFLVIVGVGALLVSIYFSTGSPGPPVTVTIPEGSSLHDVAVLLEQAGVVKRARAFEIRVETDGHAGDLKSGTYRLHTNEPYDSLVATLLKGGTVVTLKVTLPEGLTARQMAASIARQVPGFDARSYVDETLVHPLSFHVQGFHSGGPLEGFLFPATYSVGPAVTARQFIRLQLTAFRRTMAGIDLAHARSRNLTTYDVVTIASMVEREVRVAAERPLAAAVMWNRLHRRMPLQIDATVEYALPHYKTQLTYQDLRVRSPYNTYLHAGLPPTPIANPGAAALRAAAHPAAVGYLYYVARSDGSGRHYWSSTYARFLQDKARAQQ